MKNISKFTTKSLIKPELTKIYVYDSQENRIAVATDSFRLAEVVLPDDIKDLVLPGYYEPKAWDIIVKAYNKTKPDFALISQTVQIQMSLQDNYKTLNYPNYRMIIPADDQLKYFDATGMKLNKRYFSDFLELIIDPIYENFAFSDIKMDEKGKMLVYKKQNITLLLMKQG